MGWIPPAPRDIRPRVLSAGQWARFEIDRWFHTRQDLNLHLCRRPGAEGGASMSCTSFAQALEGFIYRDLLATFTGGGWARLVAMISSIHPRAWWTRSSLQRRAPALSGLSCRRRRDGQAKDKSGSDASITIRPTHRDQSHVWLAPVAPFSGASGQTPFSTSANTLRAARKHSTASGTPA